MLSWARCKIRDRSSQFKLLQLYEGLNPNTLSTILILELVGRIGPSRVTFHTVSWACGPGIGYEPCGTTSAFKCGDPSKIERPPSWALCGVRWQSESATPLWPGAERPGCRVSALRLPNGSAGSQSAAAASLCRRTPHGCWFRTHLRVWFLHRSILPQLLRDSEERYKSHQIG